jgi:chromate reductase
VGGISKGSLNKKLYRAVKENAPAGFEVDTFDISTLPFFSQDIETDTPAPVRDMKKRIEESDFILIITPEYNRGIPGVLKNAIDWGSRPVGADSWKGKKGAVMGASAGNIGTALAQNQIRQTMMHLSVQMMTQPEFYFNGSKAFDESGKLIDDKTKGFIEKFWKAIGEFAG